MNAELTAELDAYARDADGTVAVDPDRLLLTYADDTACDVAGFRHGMLVGEPLNLLLPKYVHREHADWLRSFVANNTYSRDMATDAVALRKSDGSTREIDAVITPFDGHAVIFFILPDYRAKALRAKLDAR